jgi:hypothetical protein
MGFKSHIKKILCYFFKLKYLNQKVFYPTLKKHNFFLGNIEYIYWWVSNPTFEKKNIGCRPGHRLTCRVNRVWPSHCTGRSCEKPGPVQLLGQSGPGSTYRVGPNLITMVSYSENITIARAHEISILPSCIFFPLRWVRQTISIMYLWVRETISMRPFPSCIYESHVMHLWVP